jgi:hypothetical protein
MPSPLRSPKTLFEWLQPDYYRQPRWPRRRVRLLSWGAVVAGAVFVALTVWPGRPALYQAGPVSPAHRMFNDDCGRCHTEPFEVARRLRPAESGVHSVTNEACQQCHAGGPHHEQLQDHVPACAGCHQEHRGQPLLARVADNQCTTCHGNLHRKDGAEPTVQNVHSFAGDHPEFALMRPQEPRDPSRLHFNHLVHLQPGGVFRPDGKRVALECVSCHEPDAERRYLRPIDYDQHCARCHVLSVQVVGEWEDGPTRQAAERFRARPAPHRPPEEVRATLRERLVQLAQEHPGVLVGAAANPEGRPIPGSRPQAAPPTEAGGWVEYQLREVGRVLIDGPGGCRHCHEPTGATDGRAAFDPHVPSRWLTRSRFNHDSHRMLGCTECHMAAESQRASDVLLPHIDTCRRCHNPRVGARSECVDCHGYHDRTQETKWRGPFTIDQALSPSPSRRR